MFIFTFRNLAFIWIFVVCQVACVGFSVMLFENCDLLLAGVISIVRHYN